MGKSITWCFKHFIESVSNKIHEMIIILLIINVQYLHLGVTLPTKTFTLAIKPAISPSVMLG